MTPLWGPEISVPETYPRVTYLGGFIIIIIIIIICIVCSGLSKECCIKLVCFVLPGSDLQMLVYENYSKFLSSLDTLHLMKENMRTMKVSAPNMHRNAQQR